MIGAFFAVITCALLNAFIPNLCYTEEAWTPIGTAILVGLTLFNWGIILCQFTPEKQEQRKKNRERKEEARKFKLLTPEQWKIKTDYEKAVIEKAKALSQSTRDTETFLRGQKYDNLKKEYDELKIICSNFENELKEIKNSEIYQLGLKAKERKKMTANLRKFILERDDYTCQYCGKSLHDDYNLKLEVDHIIPIDKGGKTDPSNLQTLCRKCNRSKGSKSMEVFVGAK